jgi:precorrin-8X/cobalt-precorrin-8 methylmutase
MRLDYLRDPQEIYRRSFATIREEADLTRFSAEETEIAVRMIHASAQVEIARHLVFSEGAVASGIDALRAGRPVFCDAEMVGAGIIRDRLPAGNAVISTLSAPGLAEKAKGEGTTRSAAAIDLWDERLESALVAIGNAPTALFHLLERLDAGAPRPALIIGLPIGFVGAAEAKAELIANSRGVPFIALAGRMGGSALAASAVNALAGLAGGA